MIGPSTSWIGLELSGGRYRVAQVLGQGGMGQVYRAEDRVLGLDVVIKVPRPDGAARPELAGRIIREVRALAKLAHPQIVPVLDAGEFGGLPFAVIRYLPGGSLKDRRPIGRDGRPVPLPSATLAAWLPAVARALDFMHARGYVHRDVKPDNILFDESGNAYLGDFGLAKALAGLRDAEDGQSLTQSGMVAGTPLYMAPEAFLDRPLNGRADQYSLAVLVFELLAGLRPFGGSNAMEILAQQLTQDPPDIRDVDPTIAESVALALRRGMAREPEERFPSCLALARALLEPGVIGSTSVERAARAEAPAPKAPPAAAVGGTGSMAARASGVARLPTTARNRPVDRRRPSWIGWAVLLAANAAILAIVLLPRSRANRPASGLIVATRPRPRPEAPRVRGATAAPTSAGSNAERKAEDPERTLRSAVQALGRGRFAEAENLLNVYLTQPEASARLQAVAWLDKIHRATSATEARDRLRTLSDADLAAIEDGSTNLTAEFSIPPIRDRYLETLRSQLGAERRRRAAADVPGPEVARATASEPPVVHDPIDRIQAAPAAYQGRVVEPPGYVRIATKTIEAPGGLRLIALKTHDSRTLASGLDVDIEPGPGLLFTVDPDLAARLAGWFATHRVSPTAVPEYRAALRLEVRRLEVDGSDRWAAVITGIEYLAGINYLKILNGDLRQTVTILRADPGSAELTTGDGGPWVDRLGADHIELVRQKYRDAFRRLRGNLKMAELDVALQGVMGQALKLKQQYDAEVARQNAAMIRGVR